MTRWTKDNIEQLIRMKLLGLGWTEIAMHFDTTVVAVDRKFHDLQQKGLAPYRNEHDYASKIDEILTYYDVHGHRKTLKKYGSYAIHYLKRNGLWKRSLAPVPKYAKRFLDSEDRHYWAGFIAADGCVKSDTHLTVALARKDVNHLSKIHGLMGGSLYVYPQKAEWSIHGVPDVISFLQTLNIVPRKSKILQPPVLENEDHIRDFIRGYFDGDGCVTTSILKSGSLIKNITFLGTKKMLKWISSSLSSYAKTNLVPKPVLCRGIYVINYGSTHDFFGIEEWLYDGSQVYLERKHDRFQEIKGVLKLRRSYRSLYPEVSHFGV